jgi:hypothetical protein
MRIVIVGNPIYKGKVSDGAIIKLPVPAELNELALSNDGDDWDLMCKRLPSYGFMNPIGKLHISHLMIDGVERNFH